MAQKCNLNPGSKQFLQERQYKKKNKMSFKFQQLMETLSRSLANDILSFFRTEQNKKK